MKAEAESKPYDDINITPMLDLSYVLLVIFIIMTTASVQGMKVNLPKASAKASAPSKITTKVITVTTGGKIFLDTVPLSSLAELKERLQAQKASTPDFPVVVRGDNTTPYQNVIDVLDLLGTLGLNQIGVATTTLGKS